ncbi:LOW QUALITY PROTEIN: hypothetical protein V1478_003470 [Vespula squamosa]|uniref:Uncharacterized protein n=1 Tax=Vespula squamosa TaxID=30214 RepID=A0ABD2BLY1_VESSQ
MALNGAPIIERYSYSSVYPKKPSPASEMLPPIDEMLPLESTSVELPSFEFIAIHRAQRGHRSYRTKLQRREPPERLSRSVGFRTSQRYSVSEYLLLGIGTTLRTLLPRIEFSYLTRFTVGRLPSQLHRFRLLLFNSVFTVVPVIVYRLLHNSLVEIKIYPGRSFILESISVQQGSFARWLLNRGVVKSKKLNSRDSRDDIVSYVLFTA